MKESYFFTMLKIFVFRMLDIRYSLSYQILISTISRMVAHVQLFFDYSKIGEGFCFWYGKKQIPFEY